MTATAIIGLIVALLPVAATLLNLWLKKKSNPNEIRKNEQAATDAAVISGDSDELNRILNDELQRLQAKGRGDSAGQSGSTDARQ